MRRLYHVCISSHGEVMFRDEEDFLRAINCLAIACLRTGSRIATFSFQSDHLHFDAYTDDVAKLISLFRKSYVAYFNLKYHRHGKLGSRYVFYLELSGIAHIIAAESYILHNAVHHGVKATPFGYHFNSAKCYFSVDLGHEFLDKIDFSKYGKSHFLPANNRPRGLKLLNRTGMIHPDEYMEIKMVEKNFVSPKSFLYYMQRQSSDDWKKEQERDENGLKAIDLATIENASQHDVELMLENERRRFRERAVDDMKLCSIVDEIVLTRFRKQSYAMLDVEQRLWIYRSIKNRMVRDKSFYVSDRQLYRCLGLDTKKMGIL